jgi:hypothetical protein
VHGATNRQVVDRRDVAMFAVRRDKDATAFFAGCRLAAARGTRDREAVFDAVHDHRAAGVSGDHFAEAARIVPDRCAAVSASTGPRLPSIGNARSDSTHADASASRSALSRGARGSPWSSHRIDACSMGLDHIGTEQTIQPGHISR